MLRLQPLLFQPVESLLSFSVSEMCEEVRVAVFPEIEEPIEIRFAAFGPLASIWHHFMGDGQHVVFLHPILNHPQTPPDVVRFILKHEMTHVVRPGREVEGAYESHPPEFWIFEYTVGPERQAVWRWLDQNFRRFARRTGRGYVITAGWRRYRDTPRTPYTPGLPFHRPPWDRTCPGEPRQMKFYPEWVARPLPFARTAWDG